jgi:hypothetical protein
VESGRVLCKNGSYSFAVLVYSFTFLSVHQYSFRILLNIPFLTFPVSDFSTRILFFSFASPPPQKNFILFTFYYSAAPVFFLFSLGGFSENVEDCIFSFLQIFCIFTHQYPYLPSLLILCTYFGTSCYVINSVL